jgi:hypothetical protein
MGEPNKDLQYVLKNFYKVPIENIMDSDVWNMPMAPKNASIEEILSIMTARRHV